MSWNSSQGRLACFWKPYEPKPQRKQVPYAAGIPQETAHLGWSQRLGLRLRPVHTQDWEGSW